MDFILLIAVVRDQLWHGVGSERLLKTKIPVEVKEAIDKGKRDHAIVISGLQEAPEDRVPDHFPKKLKRSSQKPRLFACEVLLPTRSL
ncbi:unnamed protein product [Nippostrongylus brasiliensis]|uniref:Nitroreductase domain-containing protein n=1 Tax=Nippostrongylus brasiliensis TaxID=27835 RepID=A0A0N4YEH2_NIPBR|nr:unnamed protein product [Nippostrongylus brasiliensis]